MILSEGNKIAGVLERVEKYGMKAFAAERTGKTCSALLVLETPTIHLVSHQQPSR